MSAPVATPAWKKPIDPHEIHRAMRLLRINRDGVTRKMLEKEFGSDRRARSVIASITENGWAAVVTAKTDNGDGEVYRIAKNNKELELEISSLESRVMRLKLRIDGLKTAWAAGGTQEPQLDLFV